MNIDNQSPVCFLCRKEIYMRKARYSISLLLTILLVFSWLVGIVQAETLIEGPIQSEDNAILAAQLERKGEIA